MKETINKICEHPIRTAILVGAITGGITRIIRAFKDYKTHPPTATK